MPVQIQRVTIKTTVQNTNVNEQILNKDKVQDNIENEAKDVNQNKQQSLNINEIVETCLDEVKGYLKQLKEK